MDIKQILTDLKRKNISIIIFGNFNIHLQRHFRVHCWRGITPGALQQALDYHIQGDPDRCALAATWGAGQARCVRGH